MINETKKDEVQRLINILLDRQIPMSELARQIDTTVQSIWRYSKGKIDNPHYRILKKLRKLNNISSVKTKG